MPLVRLCYVSQATKPDHLIRQDLMDIIDEAVIFNQQQEIYGVLYYGHGYFFQCLEGETDMVKDLFYKHIQYDRRHKNPKILHLTEIEEIFFDSWNMKFAPQAKGLMHFFKPNKENQHKPLFNPYLLSDRQLPDFLTALYQD